MMGKCEYCNDDLGEKFVGYKNKKFCSEKCLKAWKQVRG